MAIIIINQKEYYLMILNFVLFLGGRKTKEENVGNRGFN